MDSLKQAIKLTLALYRVTDCFPQDEVLKQALRKQGLKIVKLVMTFSGNKEKILKNLKAMQAYLQIAKNRKVTKVINLEVLQREYHRLVEYYLSEMKPAGEMQQRAVNFSSEKTKQEHSPKKKEINERQKTILEYLKQKQQARVGDLQNIFKNISAKTIQRDLQDLVVRNVLSKDGDKRWTTYYLTDNP